MRARYSGAIGAFAGADATRSQARLAMLFFNRMGRVSIMANSSILRHARARILRLAQDTVKDNGNPVLLPVVRSLQTYRSGTGYAEVSIAAGVERLHEELTKEEP
jgi:hypothetical protein